jgi:phosphate transporter
LPTFAIASAASPANPSSEPDTSRAASSLSTDPRSSTRLARGGSRVALSRSFADNDVEIFELVDYVRIQHRRDQQAQKRATRAELKIRQLDEADEMKFSHSIQFNAVPDWSSHYIAYSNLKKL